MGGGGRYGYPSGEVDGDVAAADDAHVPTFTNLATDDDANVPPFTEGDFVFFLGSKAPFWLGKVTDERVGADGGAEVEVRWWPPATSAIRNMASTSSVAEYGKGEITEEYKTVGNSEGSTLGGKSKKRRFVPGVEWMQAEFLSQYWIAYRRDEIAKN